VKLNQRIMVRAGIVATLVVASTVAAAAPVLAGPVVSAGQLSTSIDNVVGSVAPVNVGVSGATKGTYHNADGSAESGAGSSAERSAAARERVLASYWTPARMLAARSASEMPTLRAGGVARRAVPPASARTPVEQVTTGVPPSVGSIAVSAGARPMSSVPEYPIGHPVARTSGKVFFTSFGVDYVCSGTIVDSEGKSLVWTAGHCVTTGQAWNSNWTFVPNYSSGAAPYGAWYAAKLWAIQAWFDDNGDLANDVGAAVMNASDGKRIADVLGGQGITWDAAKSGQVSAFGYPQASPFDGMSLIAASGSITDAGDGTIYMLNDMTSGSSGGAWLSRFDGEWGYINGHNDFKYGYVPEYMYSPYYGAQVAGLYSSVRALAP
jgi:hypothetical protein